MTSGNGASTTSQTDTLRIPLVIGVSGHRDPRDQDIPALEAAIDRLLVDFQRRFPNTPITLVSPMAEGADRLAVRAARRRGASIVALLPMPRNLYEPDFATEASRNEFQNMLKDADRIVELELPPDMSPDEVKPHGPVRDGRYTAGGIEVNRASHLLFALWDGEKAVGPGGTGDSVEFMLNGPSSQLREVDDFLHFSRVAPVAHIWTPRRRGTGLAKLAGETTWLHPNSPQWNHFDQELNRQIGFIERFNADIAQREQAAGGLAHGWPLLPESARCAAAEAPESLHIDRYFRAADVIADELQLTARRTYIYTIWSGLIVLSFFQLSVHHNTHQPLFLPLSLLFTAVSAVLFFFVWKPWAHERFLDYRSLAEAMRVQFFWTIGGTGQMSIEHLPPRQHEELHSLRLCLLGCAGGPVNPVVSGSEADALRGLECVHEHWIRDQKRYFEDRAAKREDQVEWHSAHKTSLAAAGIVLLLMALKLDGSHVAHGLAPIAWTRWVWATILVLLLGTGGWGAAMGIKRILSIWGDAGSGAIGKWAAAVGGGMLGMGLSIGLILTGDIALKSAGYSISAILSVLCVVGATVLELYGEHFAFHQHMRRYRTMADLFARADEAMAPVLARKDVSEARRLIIELGRESLAENAEWLSMHRERPIRLLRPGA